MTTLVFIPAIILSIVIIALLYILLGDLRPAYSISSRTYLIGFILEIVVISLISEEQLTRTGFKLGSGVDYLMAIVTVPGLVLKSIIMGKGYDYLALLVLPLVPSISAFLMNSKNDNIIN